MTAAGLTVILPNATLLTLLIGGDVYRIINDGFIAFRVVDTSGNTIALLGSGQSLSLDLKSSATSAGSWEVHNISTDGSSLGKTNVGSVTAVSSNALNNGDGRIAICGLTTDKLLLAYSDQTNTIGRALVVDLSGTTPTYGTPFTFATGNNPTQLSLVAVSSTQAIVCYELY